MTELGRERGLMTAAHRPRPSKASFMPQKRLKALLAGHPVSPTSPVQRDRASGEGSSRGVPETSRASSPFTAIGTRGRPQPSPCPSASRCTQTTAPAVGTDGLSRWLPAQYGPTGGGHRAQHPRGGSGSCILGSLRLTQGLVLLPPAIVAPAARAWGEDGA